jgi:hypothetical protein
MRAHGAGMDRWSLRVAAYAGLMTDAYLPFRLDQGGTDPCLVLAGPARPLRPSARGNPAAAPGHQRALIHEVSSRGPITQQFHDKETGMATTVRTPAAKPPAKRSPMTSTRKTALVAGIFYLITFISIPTLALYGPVTNHRDRSPS